jgi:Tfp pilus assembly protein PilN
MVKLNLLPEKVRSAEILRLLVFAGVAVYLAAAVLMAWRFLVADRALAVVNDQIAKVEAELKPLQAIADDVKRLTDEKTEQDAKRAKLVELAKRQSYLIRLMDLVPDLMQGGQVWLTIMDETSDRTRRISLEGKAPTAEVWADFYNNLESQSIVSGLKIDAPPTAAKDGVRQNYHFRVSFVLKDTE